MYATWLMGGLRPSFMYSHLMMFEFYSVPLHVKDILRLLGHPLPSMVNDTLVKLFIALPGIMDISCGSLDFFSMQLGGNSSFHMDIVINDGMNPRLPYNFTPLFTVEIISSRLMGKSPTILILIGEEKWFLWVGYLNISMNQSTSIADICLCQHFNHFDKIADIRKKGKYAIQEIKAYLFGEKEAASCPIMSYKNPEIIPLAISLTQQYHRSLQQKFDSVLDDTCTKLMSTITTKFCFNMEVKERIISVLNGKVSQNTQINNYILNLLRIEVGGNGCKKLRKLSMQQHLTCLLYKSILEQIACLFRDCILQGNNRSNAFAHCILCGCLRYFSAASSMSDDIEDKIEKCLSDKMKDMLYSPILWPSHVLSAACNLVPALAEVLKSDLQMITSRGTKYVIPGSIQMQITNNLQKFGLCLTHRPPEKPRCPPLLKQVRLWNYEHTI